MSVKFLKNESEESLLQLIKTGDYSAFEELYARHFQTVYTTMGREVHSVYKLADHALDLWKFKEFKGIKGIRPDFVDFNTRTIYELKPYNPNGFKKSYEQLNKYRAIFEKKYPGTTWNTILATYQTHEF